MQKSLDYVFMSWSQHGRKYGRKEKEKRNKERKNVTNGERAEWKERKQKKEKVNVSDLIFFS